MSVLKKIYHRLYKAAHPQVGEIWCLHRVVPQRSWAAANRELEITPDYLEQMILSYRQRGYRFVSLDDFAAQRTRFRLPWQPKRVAISFDDGFSDIYRYAFPLFEKYHIPFAIYLTTAFPDRQIDLWWIRLEHILETQASVTLPTGEVLSCATTAERQAAYASLCDRIYQSTDTPTRAFHTLLADAIAKDTEWSAEPYLLRWEDLQTMLPSGLLTVGSHTITHPMLAKIPTEQVRSELQGAKERIEEILPIEVRHFSYPHSSYSEQVAEEVQKAGYRTATLGYGGTIRRGDNPYILNRNYIVQP